MSHFLAAIQKAHLHNFLQRNLMTSDSPARKSPSSTKMNHPPKSCSSEEGKPNDQFEVTTRSVLRNLPVLKGCLHDPDFDNFPDNPQDAFKAWLNKAIQASVNEPHAMTVSTVDDQGWPDARILILKDVDNRGWHFSVKSASPKGLQIANNNRVALTFYWPELGRQIRLRGVATRLSDAECLADLDERPLASKISALASKQSQVMADRKDLDTAMAEAKNRVENNPDTVSIDWLVYAVLPDIVEFWQGSPDRLHHRLRYSRDPDDDRWKKQFLWA